MRILEVEQMFKNEETLVQVLETLRGDFARIDEYAEIVKSETYNNSEEIKKIMQQLGGCFSNIRTVYALAVTEKDNKELAYYMKIKTEAIKSDVKFVDTAAKQESRAYVSEYRRIRNILEGYKDSAEKNISILQSCLKDEKREYNNPQQGD